MTDDRAPPNDPTDRTERMAEGLAHLQLAALELIEAARAALDVAEDLVREPAAALLMAGTLAELVRAAQGAATQSRPPTGDGGPDGEGGAPHHPHVQRVRVAEEAASEHGETVVSPRDVRSSWTDA